MSEIILKIIADIQCNIYIDYERVGIAEKGIMKKIPLRRGEYIIKLESTINANYTHQETICLDYDKIIQTDFITMANNHPEWMKDEDWHCNIQSMSLINLITGKEIELSFNYMELFSDDIIIVRKNYKWGFINRHGKEIISCRYDNVKDLTPEFICVQIEDKWGLLNKQCQQILPCIYDNIESFSNGLLLIEQSAKQGVANIISGDIIVPLQYSELRYCDENLFICRIDNKCGCIDEQNNIIIPFEFDCIGDFVGNLAVARIDDSYYYIDKRDVSDWDYPPKYYIPGASESIESMAFRMEHRIPIEHFYTYIEDFSGDLALVWLNDNVGVINSQLKEIIPTKYEDIEIVGNFIKVKYNFKWGLFSHAGLEIVPCNSEWIAPISENVICYRIGNQYSFLRVHDKTIIGEYDKISSEINIYSVMEVMKDEKWGLINNSGELIIPCVYDNLYCFKISDNLYKVEKDHKYGIITTTGNIVIPFIYDYIYDYSDFGNYIILGLKKDTSNACVLLDGISILRSEYDNIYPVNFLNITYHYDNYCILDKRNREIIFPSHYEDFVEDDIYNTNYALVSKNKKWGIIDYKLQEIVPCIYDEIVNIKYAHEMSYYNGLDYNDRLFEFETCYFKCKKNNQWIVYNISKNKFLDSLYDEIIGFIHEYFYLVAVKNHKYGYIDLAGSEVIPCTYDHASLFTRYCNSLLAEVKKGNLIGFVDIKGREVIPCKYKGSSEWMYYGNKMLQINNAIDGFDIINKRKREFKDQYLFFDTETIGLPDDYSLPSMYVDKWPRIVQLSWCITNKYSEKIKTCNYIIYPDGFTIPKDSSNLHGITTEVAKNKGKEITEVLCEFIQDFRECNYIVGHNLDFDRKVTAAELIRYKLPNIFRDEKQYICTMKESTELCSIPSFYGHKYPKLQELHYTLFGTYFEGAHNSMNDVYATINCFWELVNRKIIQPQGYTYFDFD